MPLNATPWSKLGNWNASTNNPALPITAALAEHEYYEVSTNGTFLGIAFGVGDFIYAADGSYQRLDRNSHEASHYSEMHEYCYDQIAGHDAAIAAHSAAIALLPTGGDIDAAITSHNGATDPHGDRADATTKANAAQAFAVQRANHTGSQGWGTITGTPTTLAAYGITDGQTPAQVDARIAQVVGAAPAALDTLVELATALEDGQDATAALTSSLALKAPIASPTFTGAVGGVTKAMVGLANADNTSDASKPVSTAQATADDAARDAAIAASAPAVHTHAQADVTGLVAALAGKAATLHTHTIADTTGLQAALDGKQVAGSYAAATHTHAQSEVTGLVTDLAAKAASAHTHAQSDITGLVAALAALSAPTVTTWALKPLASVAGLGAKIIVTDVGFRSEWVSTGTVWRPVNGRVTLYVNDGNLTGSASVTELVRAQVTLPAGLMTAASSIRVSVAALKSATAETCTLRLRIGALGTIVDPVHIAPTLATTVDNLGGVFEFRRASSTSMLRVGGGANTVLNSPMASNASGAAAATVANLDTLANIISVTTQHSAAVETTTIHSLIVELIA